MKELNEEKDGRIVIVIEDTDESPVEQHESETPIISIESDEKGEAKTSAHSARHGKLSVAL